MSIKKREENYPIIWLFAKKAIIKKYYIMSTLECMWRAMRLLLIRAGSDVKREGLNMHCMHKDTLTFTYS